MKKNDHIRPHMLVVVWFRSVWFGLVYVNFPFKANKTTMQQNISRWIYRPQRSCYDQLPTSWEGLELQSCHALLGLSPFLRFPASLWTRGLPSQDRKVGRNATGGPPASQCIRFTPSTSHAHAIQIITCCSSSSHRSVPKKRTRTPDWDRSLKAKATPLLPSPNLSDYEMLIQ